MQADEIKKLFSELEKNTPKLGIELKKLKLHNVPAWQFLRNLIYSDAQNLQTKRKQPIKIQETCKTQNKHTRIGYNMYQHLEVEDTQLEEHLCTTETTRSTTRNQRKPK